MLKIVKLCFKIMGLAQILVRYPQIQGFTQYILNPEVNNKTSMQPHTAFTKPYSSSTIQSTPFSVPCGAKDSCKTT